MDKHDDISAGGGSKPLLRPRSRRSWLLVSTINLLLFVLACGFWFYLRSGFWFNFTSESYHHDPAGTRILLEPMSIFSHPWLIAICALTLAILIAVPIAISVLYQFLFAAVYIAAVAVLGHSPALALALLVGCLLASRARLRRNQPMLAGLLGMVPVMIYLSVLVYAGIDAALYEPIQRWLLTVPFILACVLACGMIFLVTVLTRRLRFRPGAIWPGMTALLATAMLLFATQIGQSELKYAQLLNNLAPGRAVFAPERREEWIARNAPGASGEELQALMVRQLNQRRARLIQQCENFLHEYPDDKRAASVAWLAATAESLQLDLYDPDSPVMASVAAMALPASEASWKRVVEQYPESPQAMLGRYHLARLQVCQAAMQNEDDAMASVRAARVELERVREQLDEHEATQDPDPVQSPSVVPIQDLPSQEVYRNTLRQARRLRWWIQQNRADTELSHAIALGRLLQANPYQPEYPTQLHAMAQDPKMQASFLADNVALAIARLNPNPFERSRLLLEIAEQWATDSSVEANYELGRLRMQTASDAGISYVLPSANTYFQRVVEATENPWKQLAEERLHLLNRPSAAPRRTAHE
jgi:hypothetical protein